MTHGVHQKISTHARAEFPHPTVNFGEKRMLRLRSEGAHGMVGAQPVKRIHASGIIGAGGRRASGRIGAVGRKRRTRGYKGAAVGRKSRTRARTLTPATIGIEDSQTGSQPGTFSQSIQYGWSQGDLSLVITGAVDECSPGQFALHQKH